MRTKLLWLDLVLCSVWVLTVCIEWDGYGVGGLFASLAVLLRLSVSFCLYNKEKRTWLPLAGTLAVALLFLLANWDWGLHKLARYPFFVLNMEFDSLVYRCFRAFWIVWQFVVPAAVYLAMFFKGRLVRTEMKKRDLFGAILWKNREAKYYCALMLVCIVAFYAGLAMDLRLCRFACLGAPLLGYWLLCRYYGVRAKGMWLMLLGACVFFYARYFGGFARIFALAASFGMMAYTAFDLYRATKRLLLLAASVAYLAVLLPSFSIGYNQYVCTDYRCSEMFDRFPYKAVIIIKDKDGRYGLRDRCGLLVKPECEDIGVHRESWWSEIDLNRDGYSMRYNVYVDTVYKPNDIDVDLQKQVGVAVKKYFEAHDGYGGECEAKVIGLAGGKTLADVKIYSVGNIYYYYGEDPFLPTDSVAWVSGEAVCDTVRERYYGKVMLSIQEEVPDSNAAYRIRVSLAGETKPSEKELRRMVKEVSEAVTSR